METDNEEAAAQEDKSKDAKASCVLLVLLF